MLGPLTRWREMLFERPPQSKRTLNQKRRKNSFLRLIDKTDKSLLKGIDDIFQPHGWTRY